MTTHAWAKGDLSYADIKIIHYNSTKPFKLVFRDITPIYAKEIKKEYFKYLNDFIRLEDKFLFNLLRVYRINLSNKLSSKIGVLIRSITRIFILKNKSYYKKVFF